MKIPRGINQRDSLWSLLFVIAMRTLNYIFKKSTRGNKFSNSNSKSQEKKNNFMYMDVIKKFAKNENELESLIQIIKYIWPEMDFGIEKSVILIRKSGKRETLESIRTLGKKEYLRLYWKLTPSNKQDYLNLKKGNFKKETEPFFL